MKKIIFALLAFFACMSAKAATVLDGLSMENPVITYTSVDAQNKPITLSTRLFYKSKTEAISFVMVNCHPTITHNDGCPSSDNAQLDVVKYMVTEKALVVCPDYLGFGKTSDKTHPYMCSTLTARNVLDAYKAAIKYVKEQGCTISQDYYTISVGYSQGGATALAFSRYVETEATEEDKALVNLSGTLCGAGPYNQNTVFKTYEQWCDNDETYNLDYPIYLLSCLQGHFEAFGETTAKDISLKDCFTDDFWANCTKEGGYLDLLAAKEKTVDEMNELLKKDGFKRFYDIIKGSYADRRKLYWTIQKLLNNSNILADGWMPKAPITFYHEKTGCDIVVPYECTQEALTHFREIDPEHASNYKEVDAIADYGYTVSGVNDLWHCAVFNQHLYKWTNLKYLEESAVMLFGSKDYTFGNLDHRTFGARFYAQFLSLQLRPNMIKPTQGTAHSTNIEPVETEVTTALSLPEGAAEAGAYNRVTTTLPIYEADRLTFMQFSTPVDGFAFGWDAERYEVILNDEGEAVSYREMDYLEDFKAGEVYAISSKTPVSEVLSMTAGVQTTVQAGEQPWVKLNYRKLNSLGGKSYASAYLPFGYKAAEGADIYLVKESESEGFVTATKTEAGVSAGTGTLLISHSNAPLAVLEPDIQGEADTEKGILTGCYSETANDPDHFLLFGKSNKGNVGFWKYTTETIRPYSAFLINSSVNEAKGVEIALSEDTDAIRLIDSKEAAQGIYGIDGTKRNALQHGVNLLRNTNGSVRKVIKK